MSCDKALCIKLHDKTYIRRKLSLVASLSSSALLLVSQNQLNNDRLDANYLLVIQHGVIKDQPLIEKKVCFQLIQLNNTNQAVTVCTKRIV